MIHATPHTERLAYRLGYTRAAFAFLSRAAGMLGRRSTALIATTFSRSYCAARKDVVRVVAENLRLLGYNDPERHAPKVFENFALTLGDYFWLRGQPVERALALAEIEQTLPDFSGGAVLATGHFGFFEYGTLVPASRGIPVSVVTYAEPSEALTQWRADYRLRWGAKTIELGTDAFSSLRAATALREGQLTAMLVDRPLGGRSMDVAFPGGVIPFSTAPALLSWMVGCPVIPASVRRTTEGRFLVNTGDAITADRNLPRDEALADCTRRIANALLQDFLREPLQWYHFVPLTDAK